MCGIAGMIDLSGGRADRAGLIRMTRALAHRGPDGEGFFLEGPIGLGHRRLAIIDLSDTARQPLGNEDGRLQLIFNGEIYNFRELRRELEGLGHRFASQTDGEVILHLYEAQGPAAFARLNGMFAFALWDGRSQPLWLARDRFGIKPLYLGRFRNRLHFASEVKGLLQADGAPRRICWEALREYFTFQNLFGRQTLFDGIELLPAGELLEVAEGKIRTHRIAEGIPVNRSEPAGRTEEELLQRLTAAVNRHLISDVPVGAFLSGGMDSGALVALAQRRLPELDTFTAGFDVSGVTGPEARFDEREEARWLSRRLKTRHHERTIGPGDGWDLLPRLVTHLEELRVGMSYPNFFAAELARRDVTVVLSGVGGDELFGGYPWRYAAIAEANDPEQFDRIQFAAWCRLIPPDEQANAFLPEVWRRMRSHSPWERYRERIAPYRALPPVEKAVRFEADTFLQGLLMVEDKLSMAHGLESRVPFLDLELSDWVRGLPVEQKDPGPEGKRLLRRALAPLLPERTCRRPKQGFSPPESAWLRADRMATVRTLLAQPNSRVNEVFQPAWLQEILESHQNGRADHRLLIWSLAAFEWWLRRFMESAGEILPVPAESRKGTS